QVVLEQALALLRGVLSGRQQDHVFNVRSQATRRSRTLVRRYRNAEAAQGGSIVFLEHHLQREVAGGIQRRSQIEDRRVRFSLAAVDRPASLRLVIDRRRGVVLPFGKTLARLAEAHRLPARRQRQIAEEEI